MISNDAGFRESELGLCQGKHIDFTKNLVEITLPEENSKGGFAGGKRYLSDKTANLIKQFITGDEDFIFLPGKPSDCAEKELHIALRNFKTRTLYRHRVVYNKLGTSKKVGDKVIPAKFPEFMEIDEETGQQKFNFHSWRKRCVTEYAKQNGEAMAHGYIRHTKYLP